MYLRDVYAIIFKIDRGIIQVQLLLKVWQLINEIQYVYSNT